MLETKDVVLSLGPDDPLEEEMAIYSGILAWRVPWTEESGGLQFTGSQSGTRPHFHFHGRSILAF